MFVKISDTVMVVANKVKKIELVTGIGADHVTLYSGKGETTNVSTADYGVTGKVLLEMVASALNRAVNGDVEALEKFGLAISGFPSAYTTLRLPRETEEPTEDFAPGLLGGL